MAQSFNSSIDSWESAASIESLYLSVRTSNRLRGLRISNLEQLGRTTPKQFLAVNGFGKKCLHELSETLEEFYSRLDIRRLGTFANIVELWRPYFPHPERVPVVHYDPHPPNLDELESGGNCSAIEPIPPFEPTRSSIAQLRVQDLPISTRA